MRPAPLIALSLLLATGCRPPPAPEKLDELCGYLFSHFEDENPREMEAGLTNLETWLLKNLEDTLEGYTVSNLSEETIAALDDRSHNVDGLLGAAVGTESPYDPYAIGVTLASADQEDLMPDAHEFYERTYETDLDCWVEMECEYLETSNYMEDDYPIIGEIHTSNYGQWRWLEIESGDVMVQRTWFTGPSDVLGVDWFELNDQYYLNVLLPQGKGTLTLQTMWLEAKMSGDQVPEAIALNLLISNMINVYDQVNDYLDEHGAAEKPEGCHQAPAPNRAWLMVPLLAGLLALVRGRRRR